MERRKETFEAAWSAGLRIEICLEPVGPEHSTEELIEKLLISRDATPAYSGAARRISIPNMELERYSMTVAQCRAMVAKAERQVLDGPSAYYAT